MTPPTTPPDPLPSVGQDRPENSTARWEWLLGVVWLVFLGFPLAGLILADLAPVWLALGVGVLIAFAFIYAQGLYRLDHHADQDDVTQHSVWRLVTMLMLTLTLAPVLREEALGMLPYIVCLALLGLPLAWGLTIWIACLAVAVAVPILLGEPVAVFMAGILALVGVAVLIIRVVERREERDRALADELRLSQERDRVARDVHDVLGHSLTVATIKVELAERLIDIDPERAKAELAQVRSMTRQSLAEIRATVSGLRVAQLTDEMVHARDALRDAGIEPDLPDDPEVVDPLHRSLLAWALREGVTNVVRHSGATRCQVAWGASWMTVTDDGVGWQNASEGNGIRGLRERVRPAGGTVYLTEGPGGKGTEMRVQL